jgi:hypothetical protein
VALSPSVVPNATIHSLAGKDPFLFNVKSPGSYRSDLLVRHERLTHRKDRENQKDRVQSSTEPSHVPAQEPPRKRMRASFDTGRPVPEIPGMMSSPAVTEMQPGHYTPATAFTPMGGANSNSYSLTALSMAAEYQALQNLPNDSAINRLHYLLLLPVPRLTSLKMQCRPAQSCICKVQLSRNLSRALRHFWTMSRSHLTTLPR